MLNFTYHWLSLLLTFSQMCGIAERRRSPATWPLLKAGINILRKSRHKKAAETLALMINT
jgi:hypothetical protein